MASTKVTDDYGVKQIHVLEGLEAVKARPGMYIGSTSQSGIDQLVYEVIDNSIDEFVAGWGKEISVTVCKDCSVETIDHGRGIPVGKNDTFKDKKGNPIDALTGILTNLHAGGKFKTEGYKCFTADSKVETAEGLKTISEIEPIKDYVVNSYNELVKVDNKFEYDYDGEINCIELENGKEVKAINGHYILVQTQDGQLVWKKIEDIIAGESFVELEETDNIEELKKIIPIYNKKKY
jgi:hypothetical protein